MKEIFKNEYVAIFEVNDEVELEFQGDTVLLRTSKTVIELTRKEFNDMVNTCVANGLSSSV